MDIKPEETVVFNKWPQFVKWKDDIEQATMSYYSARCGQRNTKYMYYYCQRDGSDRSHLKSGNHTPYKRRQPNLKGKIKTGATCTSMLKVKKEDDGLIVVKYFATHSHPVDVSDLKHQPLNKQTNEFINKQLALGVAPEKILNTLKGNKFSRSNRDEKVLNNSRNDFILLKTIRERRRRILNKTYSLASDDSSATMELIKSLQAEPYNPILIFKPIGCLLISGPDSAKKLPLDTFILGLQTKEQLKLMEKCAKEILVIDGIQDMTQFGCRLINIMGVDELNKGYPLGHCVTNKIDETTLQHFFSGIKERSPALNVNCIITSDENPALINAAKVGFNQNSIKHILCLCNFKRSLQKQLRMKVRKETLEEDMFKFLCTLVDSSTESEFTSMTSFLEIYDQSPEASSFINYFNTQCIPIQEKWAKCFRQFPHKDVDTTVYVESFHNLLKSLYEKRQLDKRIETLISLLLEVEEDCYARSCVSLSFHEREAVQQSINTSHKHGMTYDESNVTEVLEDLQWKVISDSTEGESYFVVRSASTCTNPEMCIFQCTRPVCSGLCSHLYVCTCLDENTLCKHIHKVHSLNLRKSKSPQVQFMSETELYNSPTCSPFDSHLDQDEINSPTELEVTYTNEECKRKILEMNTELVELIENDCVPQHSLPHVSEVLSSLLELFRAEY